jgi:PAS domain S-box-containing protein
MDQVIAFFKGLFDTSDWPPRWHCGQWSSFHGWFYIISDLLIWSAYFAIPLIIIDFISKRNDVRFHRIYFLFAAFILACGLTHLIDAAMFWMPMYRLSALVRFITGVLSWFTVYSLFKVLPFAFSLKSAAELEKEVAQRIKAEEELQFKILQLNEAQEIANMGHWEWNIKTDKVTWSDQLFRIYGLSISQNGLDYKSYLEYIHPDDRDNVDAIIQQAFDNRVMPEYYHRIVTPEGKIKTLLARGEVVTKNGEVIKMIGTGQDVTSLKETEQNLLIKTSDLELMNEELQKFAYVASHDLQEPLRKIKTYISLLQGQGASEIDDEKRQLYRQKIVHAADRMQNLIEDILNFSRISTSGIDAFEKTDLNSVLKSVLIDMETVVGETNAKISTEPLPTIAANSTQIRQLFQNLFSNAIKFTKKGEVPVIEIKGEIISGRNVSIPVHIKSHYKFTGWDEKNYWAKEKFCKISIKDHGIGFDNKYKDKIFEAFQRLNTPSQYGGTGIGLAICKKIAEFHHGTITAESEHGKFTSFTIFLPVQQDNFKMN